MSSGIGAVHDLFLNGWAAVSRLFVLAGLISVLVSAGRFLGRRRSVALASAGVAPPADHSPAAAWRRGPLPALWWPLALLWVGFLLGTGLRSTLWQLAVGILVATGVGLGVHTVRVAHRRRGDAEVAPATVAALLSVGTFVLFGLMLLVRLVVVPDPTTGVRETVTADSAGEAMNAVLIPASVLVLVIAALPRLGRRAPRLLTRLGNDNRGSHVRHLAAILVVSLLFAAPLLGGGAHLTIAGVATPEYGKILHLCTLASVLATYTVRFRMTRSPDRHHLWYPIGLFTVVALTCVAKQDLGPLIPLFVATVAMFSSMLVLQANRTPEVLGAVGRKKARARRRVALRHARPLRWPLAVLLLVGTGTVFLTDYVSERGAIWADPWVYSWSAHCAPPPDDVTLPPTPEGTIACQLSYASAEASRRSQMSQSLAVIADGGVWGRGLDDTTSGRMPAGSTDFVLTVVWSKLGGLVVLLLAAVMAMLAAALTRIGGELSNARPAAEGGRAFVVGVAALLLSQFVFVLAATVNAVPHSGITVPFLSRGGHSTIALGVGVIAAITAQYVSSARRAEAPRTTLNAGVAPATVGTWWVRPRLPATMWSFAVCLALVAGITVAPYSGLAEDRPFCLTAEPEVSSANCSTDRIAYDRTSIRIVVDGVPQLRRTASSPGWDVLPGATLSLADFGGLLQAGAEVGALDAGLVGVLNGASGTSLGQRMGPSSAVEKEGALQLTVDPRVQAAASRALPAELPLPGGKISEPLAGGVVAIEARTGRVLAAASAPADVTTVDTAKPVTREQFDRFAAEHPFGTRDEAGNIDESAQCREAGDDAVLARCWRWSLTVPGNGNDTVREENRMYVEDDKTVEVPPASVNRALGRQYGLGSTFKVVVAAAFIKYAAGTADSEIAAPNTVRVGDQVIENAGKGACPRSNQGQITLRDALAVSCNTAFVALAMEKLGWDKIRDMARDLGFAVAPAAPGTAWLARTPAGVDSHVPATPDRTGIANNTLGGGDVVGTPLQMATVLGAVANDGTVVQPTFLDAVTDPVSGNRTTVTGERRQVLDQDQAAQLRDALSATTQEGGTADTLQLPRGTQAWVKSGTHVLFAPDEAKPGTFTHQIAWLVGYVDTGEGPVSFAVAVETRDEDAGRGRARALAAQLIADVVEGRR
jgi:cell division protein FtsI/penicillin-binding protein 2/cell division protein FtsW (lipid II flippase)